MDADPESSVPGESSGDIESSGDTPPAETEPAEAQSADSTIEDPANPGDPAGLDDPQDDDLVFQAGDELDDDIQPTYVVMRQSSPGWAIGKWVLSGTVAVAVVLLCFLLIPRLFSIDLAGTADPSGTADPTGTDETTPSSAGNTTQAPPPTYAELILAAQPTHYWQFLPEAAGDDSVANAAHLEIGPKASVLASGAYPTGKGALECTGTLTSRALSELAENPGGDFSIELWIKTASANGGPVVSFGDKETGASKRVDRTVYLAKGGALYFGADGEDGIEVVDSPNPVNDGNWHHVVATMSSSAGLVLYVNGAPVASNDEGTTVGDFPGYWRICGDNASGWPKNSGRPAFTGSVDDVAVYSRALAADEVAAHHATAAGQ